MLFVAVRPAQPFSLFPPTTETTLGHSGDPINIAFLGTRDEITNTFLTAHWLIPDSVTATSTTHLITTSVLNASYPTAPVSNLYLFGRQQDLTFELPTDSVKTRHHVRLWETTQSISGKTLWIGSASYDAGLELSGATSLPTHHISPNVDGERNFLVTSLKDTNLIQVVQNGHISYPTPWGFNGGGDWYFDDGIVRVLELK